VVESGEIVDESDSTIVRSTTQLKRLFFEAGLRVIK